MSKYDARNKERRHNRNEKHFLRANQELSDMIYRASKDITISVLHDVPDTARLDYVVLFTLKKPLTPIEFQTLLRNKMSDLV